MVPLTLYFPRSLRSYSVHLKIGIVTSVQNLQLLYSYCCCLPSNMDLLICLDLFFLCCCFATGPTGILMFTSFNLSVIGMHLYRIWCKIIHAIIKYMKYNKLSLLYDIGPLVATSKIKTHRLPLIVIRQKRYYVCQNLINDTFGESVNLFNIYIG